MMRDLIAGQLLAIQHLRHIDSGQGIRHQQSIICSNHHDWFRSALQYRLQEPILVFELFLCLPPEFSFLAQRGIGNHDFPRLVIQQITEMMGETMVEQEAAKYLAEKQQQPLMPHVEEPGLRVKDIEHTKHAVLAANRYAEQRALNRDVSAD